MFLRSIPYTPYRDAFKIQHSVKKMSKIAELFPYEIHDLDQEIIKKYQDLRGSYVTVGPKKFCLYENYKNEAHFFYNFQVRPEDVWILGVPRSGTTLVQEIVWLLENDLNYEKAAASVMDVRFPVFENSIYSRQDYERILREPEKYSEEYVKIAKKLIKPSWETLSETTEKRFIKTHLPFSLAPRNLLKSGCKILYLVRNPKDVCVSMYLLMSAFSTIGINIDFETFWNEFKEGLVFSTPYFEHVKEGWKLRNHENVLFLNYDEFTKDIKQTILEVAYFLGKKITDEELDTLQNHLKIDNFRKNKSVNNDHLKVLGLMKNLDNSFIRKGKVGGWRDYFSDNLNVEADIWIEENLKDTDLEGYSIC